MSPHADPGVRPQPAATFELRYDGKRAEVAEIYQRALPELVFRAQSVHGQRHAPNRGPICQLLSHQNQWLTRGLRVLPAERAL